jgi:hypothetical protein
VNELIVEGYAGDCQEFLFGAGIQMHEHRKLIWPRARRHIEQMAKRFALKGAQWITLDFDALLGSA